MTEEVFISYNRDDLLFVEELYRRLTRDGVSCFFDQLSVEWGDNAVLKLEDALDKCSSVILVLTPKFCTSDWTALERTSAMADDPAGDKRKLLPLLLRDCGTALPRLLQPIQRIDVSTQKLFEENYPKICKKLGGTLRKQKLPADPSKLPPPGQLPPKHRLPFPSLGKKLAGRVSELWAVHDALTDGQTAVVQGIGVVVGTGGLGKTQLAIEYAHRFASLYPGGIFWVDAERGLPTLLQQVSTAADLDLDGRLSEEIQLQQLWLQLSQWPPVLLVLDNFAENEALQRWLPTCNNVHTLVTTRRRDLSRYSLTLDFLDAAEGLELLNSGARRFGDDAKALVEMLGGLPLALELARHFLNLRTELTIAQVVEEIKQLGEMQALQIFAEKYGNDLPSGHTKEVAATFQLSWQLASPLARDILQALACLAPTAVPRRILRSVVQTKATGALSDLFADALSELATRLSLVELDEALDPRLHRLIAGFVRSLAAEDLPYEKVTEAVLTEMTRSSDDFDTASFRELEKVLPHAEHLLNLPEIKPDTSVDLAGYIGWHQESWGRFRSAETFRRQALDLAQKSFEPGHPSIAISQLNLAVVLKKLGVFDEGLKLITAAYESFLSKFGEGHPHTQKSKSWLEEIKKAAGE